MQASLSPYSFLSPLHCAVAGHFWASKWGDGVGLHGLVNQEQERCHNGQQEQLDPQRQAPAHRFGLTCRCHCWQGSWGGERRGGGRRGEGSGGGKAGDPLEFLRVGGWQAAGCGGGFRRKEAVFIIPQVTGLDRTAGSSSDGSSTSGSTVGNNHFLYFWIVFCQQITEPFSQKQKPLEVLTSYSVNCWRHWETAPSEHHSHLLLVSGRLLQSSPPTDKKHDKHVKQTQLNHDTPEQCAAARS